MPARGLASVTITATATATTTATAAAAALWSFLARPRLIVGQGPALEVFLMEHGNRLGRIFLRRHLDKGESTRSPRRAVLHDIDPNHRASLGKMILQIVFGCSERQITNE